MARNLVGRSRSILDVQGGGDSLESLPLAKGLSHDGLIHSFLDSLPSLAASYCIWLAYSLSSSRYVPTSESVQKRC